MKKGMRVNIYHDPITVSDFDESVIIFTTPKPDCGSDDDPEYDAKGRILYRAVVEYDDGQRVHRTFSEKA